MLLLNLLELRFQGDKWLFISHSTIYETDELDEFRGWPAF